MKKVINDYPVYRKSQKLKLLDKCYTTHMATTFFKKIIQSPDYISVSSYRIYHHYIEHKIDFIQCEKYHQHLFLLNTVKLLAIFFV